MIHDKLFDCLGVLLILAAMSMVVALIVACWTLIWGMVV